nr:hypothetical protein [Cytophagales bacterium]
MNEFALLLRKDFYILINNLKLILKNPLRLIPYLFIFGYFGIFYFFRGSNSRSTAGAGQVEDLQEAMEQIDTPDVGEMAVVRAITLLALAVMLYLLFRATKKNVTFFTMADVNLLFTSPVKPSRLLLYYMIRSIFPALGGSLIFIIYGTAQLNDLFDFNLLNLSIMAIGLALFFFILSPIRFLIYTLHTKYDIVSQVKAAIFLTGSILLLMILIPGLMAESFYAGMFAWIASPWFNLFPMVGWSRGIVSFVVHGNLWIVAGLISCYAAAYTLIVHMVLTHSGHYYEDVLESTQAQEETKEKIKTKTTASESSMSLNTNKKLVFKEFGTGATAIYWRNYVHGSRQDFHPLFGVYGLAFAGIGVLMAILSRFPWFSHWVIYGYLILLIFIYFMAGIGRVNVGDLKKPFIILIPASWGAKFWNLIRLDLYQTLIFSLFLIVPTVLIGQLAFGLIVLFPLCLLFFYVCGFSINMAIQLGFDEGWDRKLVRPLIMGAVLIFGVLPSLGSGVFVALISKQFVYGMLAMSLGMGLLAAVMLHVAYDVISRLEFKEM